MALDDLGCCGSCGAPSCFALLHDAPFARLARTARASGGQPTASALGQRRCRLGPRHAGAAIYRTLPTSVATSVGPRRPWCRSARDWPRGRGRSFGRLQPSERTGRCHGGSYGRHCCINLASSQIRFLQVNPASSLDDLESPGLSIRLRRAAMVRACCLCKPGISQGCWLGWSLVRVGRIAFEKDIIKWNFCPRSRVQCPHTAFPAVCIRIKTVPGSYEAFACREVDTRARRPITCHHCPIFGEARHLA